MLAWSGRRQAHAGVHSHILLMRARCEEARVPGSNAGVGRRWLNKTSRPRCGRPKRWVTEVLRLQPLIPLRCP